MDSRQQFEDKYPLPEGMFFDESQGSYAGTKDFWLWCTRWESWQESRESLVVDLGSMTNNGYEGFYPANQIKRSLRDSGIRTK